jgi:hypothetical protein
MAWWILALMGTFDDIEMFCVIIQHSAAMPEGSQDAGIG